MLDFHSCDSFNPCLEKTKQNKTKQNKTTTTLKTADKQNKLILNNWKIESCDP